MRIIPAIDIIDGKCVRLTKGDYDTKKIYNEDPLEVAKTYEDHGIQFLHLVDLDGARSKRIINHKILEKIATHTNLNIDFGGGLKSDEDLRIAFESGAKQITGGSIAAKNRGQFLSWLEKFGAQKIILGADCMNRKIATDGWENTTGIDVLDFIYYYKQKGILYTICTDISKDGMLEGPALGLYQDILQHEPKLNLIASGGVSRIEDLHALANLGCEGVIIGKAIYENKISLTQISTLC